MTLELERFRAGSVSRGMAFDLVALAQESPTAEAFETNVLELFQRKIGFDAALFLVKGLEPFTTMAGLDQKAANRLLAHGATYAEELLPVKQAALNAHGVAVDTEVCGAAYVRRTAYYREIASTIGGRHSLMAYVPWRGRVVAAMMLGRGGNGFCEREIKAVESLLPALGVARAAYGLPWVTEPLRAPSEPGLLTRLGFPQRRLASVRTERGILTVRDRGGYREMVARQGTAELIWTRASLQNPSQSGWAYVELFHLAAALARHRRRALFVGCGGAVSLRQFASSYPGIAIDLVEHEPAVIELARAWFDLAAIPNASVHLADGAAFIRDAPACSWDIIVIDAYDAVSAGPDFSQPDFLAASRRALQPGGALACNVIGTLSGPGPVANFVSSARSVFDSVRMVPVVDVDEDYAGDTLRNVVVVATCGDAR